MSYCHESIESERKHRRTMLAMASAMLEKRGPRIIKLKTRTRYKNIKTAEVIVYAPRGDEDAAPLVISKRDDETYLVEGL